jgi:hypothetical protein
MSQPASRPAVRRLCDEIYSCYASMIDVSGRTADMVSADAVARALRAREVLLLKVQKYWAALREIASPRELAGFESSARIKKARAGLCALDQVIAAAIASRMNEIRRSLAGLRDASGAAKAYLRQARS